MDVGVAATGISRHLFSSIFALENEWNAAKKERRAGNEEIFLFALRFAYRMNVRQLRGYRYFYPKLVAIPGGSLPVFSSYFEKEKMDVGPKIFRLAPRYVGSEADESRNHDITHKRSLFNYPSLIVSSDN